jgi:hypothetical protein
MNLQNKKVKFKRREVEPSKPILNQAAYWANTSRKYQNPPKATLQKWVLMAFDNGAAGIFLHQ